MRSTFQKALLSWQKAGHARTFQRALQSSVPSWLFDFNSLFALEIDFVDARFPPVSLKWSHRWTEDADRGLLTQGGLTEGEVQHLLDEDGRAAICVKDGKLVAYTWYVPVAWTCFGWIRAQYDRRVFATAAYVAPEYRGHRLHSETRYFAYPALGALGYVGLVSFIERLNHSSMRTGVHSPRRYVGRLFYVRLLGLVIYRLDGKWGAGFWNRSRPFHVRFEDFDREHFHTSHKNAISALDDG